MTAGDLYPGDEEPTNLEDLLKAYEKTRMDFPSSDAESIPLGRRKVKEQGSYCLWVLDKPVDTDSGEKPLFRMIPESYFPREALLQSDNGNVLGVSRIAVFARELDIEEQKRNSDFKLTFPSSLEWLLSDLGVNDTDLRRIFKDVYNGYFSQELSKMPWETDGVEFLERHIDESVNKVKILSKVDCRRAQYTD